MALLARLAAFLADRVFAGLWSGLADGWARWRARSDAIEIGRNETIIEALEKAVAHEQRMADEALSPPDAGDVDRRLRDGSF